LVHLPHCGDFCIFGVKLASKLMKKKVITNPTGKGGFKDNPQNKANGRWTKETSISYNYNYLIRLSQSEFEKFKPQTIAQELAYNAILEAKGDLPYLKEVTDRTEGKAIQAIDHTTDGEKINQVTVFELPSNGREEK